MTAIRSVDRARWQSRTAGGVSRRSTSPEAMSLSVGHAGVIKRKDPERFGSPNHSGRFKKARSRFSGKTLPGATNRVDSELIGMRWPDRSRVEQSTLATLRCRSTKLVVERGHGVLTDAPRIILLHGSIRRHYQSGRLPELKVIESAMPWTQLRLLSRPSISVGAGMMIGQSGEEAIGILSHRLAGAGQDKQEAECREGFCQGSQHESALSDEGKVGGSSQLPSLAAGSLR